MRSIKIKFISIVCVLISLSTYAQLSGTYTIGGAAPDYATINAAISALHTVGVSGPVIMNIRAGIYNEQFSINDITGASSLNTITIKSETNNAADVLINRDNSLSNNYIVELFNTSYINIEHITFTVTTPNSAWHNGTIIYLSNVHDISVKHCVMNGLTHIGSYNQLSAVLCANQFSYYYNISIEDNVINNGSYSIDFRNGTLTTQNIFISSNTFSNPGGIAIYIYNIQNNVSITDNTIVNTQNYINIAIEVTNCQNNLKVKNNSINVTVSQFCVKLYNCSGEFTNNFILNSSSPGHALTLSSCQQLNIHHNNFKFELFGISFDNGNLGIEVLNNNFKTVNGYALNCGSQSINTTFSNIDYNNYYISGNGAIYQGIANLKCTEASTALYGFDEHSLSVDPLYTSVNDLHANNILLKNAGTSVGEPVDIDSLSRDPFAPTIGANELSSLGLPLSGIYSVGPAGYFTSLNQVLDSLELLGISGNVTFDLLPATYTAQMTIGKIKGLNDPYTLTFRSSTFNANDVIITNNGNNILTLDDADNIRFDHLTFKNTSAVSGVKAIRLQNRLKNIRFSNNIFNFNAGQDVIFSEITKCIDYIQTDSIVIHNNVFIGGRQIIDMSGGSIYNNSLNTIISRNTFATFNHDVITLKYQESAIIDKDSIYGTTGNGITLIKCSEKTKVSRNKITGVYTGILIDSCYSSAGNEALISNNFINAGPPFAYGVFALKLNQSFNQQIYHNSINLIYDAMSFGGNTCLFSRTSSTCRIMNNIFKGKDWILDCDSIGSFDYNDFYTTEPQIGNYKGTVWGTFAAFKAGSMTNANSLNIDPVYYSASDLHTNNLNLKRYHFLPEVPEDIDGIIRHTTHPFIGATEVCKQPIAAFTSDSVCLGTAYVFINTSYNTDPSSVFSWDFENNGTTDATGPGNVSFTYPSAITYTPELIVINSNGCKDTIVKTITVLNTTGTPVPFTIASNGQTISFSDNTSNYTSWLWDFGDGTTSTLQNPVHTYTVPGIYNVCRTDINLCASITFCDSINILPLDIIDQSPAPNFTVFPNPANSSVTVFLDELSSTPVSLRLYNSIGVLVYQENDLSTKKPIIDLSLFPNGLYQIQVTVKKNKVVSKKLIINK